MELDNEEIKQLLIGSSVHACGGGGPLDVALDLLEECSIAPIELCDPDTVDGTAITVYGVGASDATVADEPKQVTDTVDQYIHETGTMPDAIYPSECGPLAVLDAMIAADHLDLPLLDCDAADGRCVPLVTMTPLAEVGGTRTVVLTSGGQQDHVEGSLQEIEQAAQALDGLVFLGGQAHHTATLAEHVVPGTMTEALETDENGITADEIGTGTINAVSVLEKDRILHGSVSIENVGELTLKNEYWTIETDEMTIGPPAKIMLIEPATGHGVPSGALKEGKNVTVMVETPRGYWKTEEGKATLDEI